MQVFSYMQRSFDDKKTILIFFIFLLSIFYEAFTTIHPLLPPLLGVAFWIFLSKRNGLIDIYIFLWTIFFEVDHSLPLFSTIISFIILKNIFLKLKQILFNKFLLKILSVMLFYIFYPIFLLILNKIFLTDMIAVNLEYIKYMLVETILVLVMNI